MPTQSQFDVAIIGSGITGSTLAAILARHGLRVIVFEAGQHPKFAIGESMILETSETMRAVAQFFDVPELAFYSSENYFDFIGASHGVKRHFSYLHHTPGQTQQIERSLQAVIPKEPHGHELHLFRQDVDAYLTLLAIHYGAEVRQNTRVNNVDIDAEGVSVTTHDGATITADFIVDAGGFRSLIADQFGLRDFDLQAHSRTIFTHMIDVPCFHDVGASRQAYGLPFRVSEGTLHHVFKGGWLWIIPFNNHSRATNPLCSVGLQLDPRRYPVREDMTPEQEFYNFIAQYPSMLAQLKDAKAVRNWTRTNRIQFSSKHVVGDRFALLGHAAGFIDPLYSKGLYTSFMSLGLLAHLLLDAYAAKDYRAERFAPLETQTLAFVRTADRLTANSYKSWGNYKLWSVYAVLWMLGAYLELVKLMSLRGASADRRAYFEGARHLKLAGGAFVEFDQLADSIDRIVEDVNIDDETAVDAAVTQIRALYAGVDWIPDAFVQVLRGKNHLPANKFRLSLFDPEDGFLGHGAFRQHFFGDHSMTEVAKQFVVEKVKYSTVGLRAARKWGLGTGD
ncbi:MAG: NAD(P)/FAD-dependent oxidoreductase [Caldilineaceae bacterium]|nr:NAD(P)/FAD-dependent oxidoreductase [Caldilineaceae bacterium]